MHDFSTDLENIISEVMVKEENENACDKVE